MTLNSEPPEADYSARNDEPYRVSISGYRLAEVTHGKRVYFYTVEVKDTKGGAKYCIHRRYSEFNALHRTLKKECDTAPFPPKRVRNSQPKVLEQRRAALELYVKKMLKLETTKRQVLEFLGIEGVQPPNSTTKKVIREADSGGSKKIYNNCPTIGHHPVMTFARDPYLRTDDGPGLPDIVIQGVLMGIYKPENY